MTAECKRTRIRASHHCRCADSALARPAEEYCRGAEPFHARLCSLADHGATLSGHVGGTSRTLEVRRRRADTGLCVPGSGGGFHPRELQRRGTAAQPEPGQCPRIALFATVW